jgi:HEAT repeat protein
MSENNTDTSPETAVEEAMNGDDEELLALVETLSSGSVDSRKVCLRSLEPAIVDDPTLAEALLPTCERLLTDDDRSVRLTTAKLFVAVAADAPDAVVPAVSSLAERLADDDEFYYVRARSAEALGYVALEHPEEVGSPEILADLRVGLAFDEPEVKEKLAKALEFVALANPKRLRHQLPKLADHLDDESDLVRYHLTTALLAVGCAYPERLEGVQSHLDARLADENAHVRGRAAEALGVFARETGEALSVSEQAVERLTTDGESFVRRRARFALASSQNAPSSADGSESIGTLTGVRSTTASALEAITAPDGDGGCPHCGLDLPEPGPPMCPRCGTPR